MFPWHGRSEVKNPLTIWILRDGKPGHENQSLGLAEAIGRRVPCDIHSVSIAGVKGLRKRIQAAMQASAHLPKPDFIIGAGHATHPSLLWLAHKYDAKSIVLMKPSFPMSWFDLCIAPDHDFPRGGERQNLLLTHGALNRVEASELLPKTGKIILVGGPSTTHGWDGKALLEAIGEITLGRSWLLADSRRTPASFAPEVASRFPELQVVPYADTTPDWLPTQLKIAEEVWVTEDSVSMIYEALTSGAKVGVLPAPRITSESRVLRGLDDLVRNGFLTTFEDWKKAGILSDPPEVLREADRCAGEVLTRFPIG